MCHKNQCFYPLKMKHENLQTCEKIRFAQITTLVLSLIFELNLVNIWVLVVQDNVKPHRHANIWSHGHSSHSRGDSPFDLQLPWSLNYLCTPWNTQIWGKQLFTYGLIQKEDGKVSMLYPWEYNHLGVLSTCLRLNWQLLPKSTYTATPNTFSCHFSYQL